MNDGSGVSASAAARAPHRGPAAGLSDEHEGRAALGALDAGPAIVQLVTRRTTRAHYWSVFELLYNEDNLLKRSKLLLD